MKLSTLLSPSVVRVVLAIILPATLIAYRSAAAMPMLHEHRYSPFLSRAVETWS